MHPDEAHIRVQLLAVSRSLHGDAAWLGDVMKLVDDGGLTPGAAASLEEVFVALGQANDKLDAIVRGLDGGTIP